MEIYYSNSFLHPRHEFDTFQKSGWIVTSLKNNPLSGIKIANPPPIETDQLLAIHASDYVQAVKTGSPVDLAQSNGFIWGEDTWGPTLAVNSGVVAASLEAYRTGKNTGSLSSGLHHARHAKGRGFCTFNGIALAALEAQRAGAKNVLILDLDAHCGGGTYSIIEECKDIVQVDLSVDPFDHYLAKRPHYMTFVTQADKYIATLRNALAAFTDKSFDLCIYNAGMDVYEKCWIGGIEGMTTDIIQERERTVFEWCSQKQIPVAFLPAGGYTNETFEQEELVALHRMTLEAATQTY